MQKVHFGLVRLIGPTQLICAVRNMFPLGREGDRDLEGEFIGSLGVVLDECVVKDNRPGPPDIEIGHNSVPGKKLLAEIKIGFLRKDGRFGMTSSRKKCRHSIFWDYGATCDVVIFALPLDGGWESAIVPLRDLGVHRCPDLIDSSISGVSLGYPQPAAFMNSSQTAFWAEHFSAIFNTFSCPFPDLQERIHNLVGSKADAPKPIASVPSQRPKRRRME